MQFGELVDVTSYVHYTCFVWNAGKFRQWYPARYGKDVGTLDQMGEQLKKQAPELMQMRVHSVHPTDFNYMNVYLY